METVRKKDRYAVDTVALLSYFADKLKSRGHEIFLKAENNMLDIVVPSIVIGETIYIIKKGREVFGKQIEEEKIDVILKTIYENVNFYVVDLNLSGWNTFLKSEIIGLHDRMIVATCVQEEVDGLISCDDNIIESGEISTYW